MSRHPDFQRILDEHNKYYCDGKPTCEAGVTAYNTWLNLLEIDENKPYGWGLEAFRFAKDIFTFAKEDKENKYYKVLVGFPLKSMNGNVYTEKELKAATETLIGIVPNLNHYPEYSLEDVRVGLKVEFVGAAYEDGAAEAVLKVPKALVCPDCSKGTTICDLIDNKIIVNVSLEASCERENQCNNMKFTGCALLTAKNVDGSPHKKTLPGIPLARIFPLEMIVAEAFRAVKEGKKPKRKSRIEIIGLGYPPENFRYAPWDQDVIYPDAKNQCPKGWMLNISRNECLPVDCPAGFVLDATRGECIPLPVSIPEGTKVVMGIMVGDDSHKPVVKVKREKKPIKAKKSAQELADDDLDRSTILLRAVRAENRNKGLDEQVAELEVLLAKEIRSRIEEKSDAKASIRGLKEERDRLLETEKTRIKDGKEKDTRHNKAVQEHLNQIEQLIKAHNERILELEKQIIEKGLELETIISSRDDYKNQAEAALEQLTEMTTKYNESLATNLKLTNTITELNEDMIKLTGEVNIAKESLKSVKKSARRIIATTNP